MNDTHCDNLTPLQDVTRQYQEYLSFSEELMGEPVRGFTLLYDVKSQLLRQMKSSRTLGLRGLPPIRTFTPNRKGRTLEFGIHDCQIRFGDRDYRVLQICNDIDQDRSSSFDEFWVIAAKDYLPFYRDLRRMLKLQPTAQPPLMTESDFNRLWRNTIGFLQRGEEALQRFGVSLKRGVLLMGAPGNGKTTACRWLESEADRLGYEWRTVSSDQYQNMCGHGQASRLFDLDRPGFVLFDDLDHALRNREDGISNLEQSRFLSELDGIRVRQGVVYLFTTNAGIDDLDPAFRRPGRIDHMIHFSAPNPDLRRDFMSKYWPREIAGQLPLDRAVEETGGLSFAELDEIKKQLVLNYLDSGHWDWDEALGMFRIRMEDETPKKFIGFNTPRV
ncbi:MAG: ATP-binding protein [Planctomycetaceae bacterium]|nr:ATP-binding protein [Planctomycetaceae bacterium]